MFPLCTVGSITRVGSDHWPVVLEEGSNSKNNKRVFRFENSWVQRADFQQMVRERWQQRIEFGRKKEYSLDKWHKKICRLRSFLKGWGGNLKGEHKRIKEEIRLQIRLLDELDMEGGLKEAQYEERYRLEEELEDILAEEELYWQQRGSEKWVLQEDSNTNFFSI